MNNDIKRLDWVYWVILILLVCQTAWWFREMQGIFNHFWQLAPAASIYEIFRALWDAGVLRFVDYYLVGFANIALAILTITLLAFQKRSARQVFLISLGVAVFGQLLDALIVLPTGNGREWFTTIAGNLALALQLWLFLKAFNHICQEEPLAI